jgi:pullulanase-type alpha-1,6-glucosidase
LDRIVPGYYHRLDSVGSVTTSTCCDNTATENPMMGKLMSDSVLLWARDYKISSFRFDIMGHQPRSVMEDIKARLKSAIGRDIQLIGEGWNFGEVADGARFVQASMFSLNGSGIATFNPYARDAVRGGSPFDSGTSLIAHQGFINGLFFDPNGQASPKTVADLRWQGDIIRAGLAGSVRPFVLQTHQGNARRLDEVWVYPGQSAGYVSQPGEVVNYVENHDNQTLFDINAMKLPASTSRQDRARVQILGAAVTAFSQGIAYYHAGIETLRSKSLDRNSYDAGDWFNRLDWTYADNNFGVGLPMSADNGNSWSVMRPILSNTGIKPSSSEITWTRDAFADLLRIRASTTLLRLRTTEDIVQRLSFPNSGPDQISTVLMGRVDGTGYPGAQFKELVYLINVDTVERTVVTPALQGKAFVLHPVHTRADAADTRARQSTFSPTSGSFKVPARTAVVFVVL